MTTIVKGQTRRIRCSFVDASETPQDPETVTLRIGRHTGGGAMTEIASYSKDQLTREAVGVYSKDYTFTQAGEIVIRFATTGIPTTVVETVVRVEELYTWP